MMRRRIGALAGAAPAALCVWVMERPQARFVMTTFDPGTSRAEHTRG
jgi:hypothetical protein